MADEVFERALHAMSDVQRRSVEAASALVERLVNNVDGHRATERDDEGTDPPSANDDVLADSRDCGATRSRVSRESSLDQLLTQTRPIWTSVPKARILRCA